MANRLRFVTRQVPFTSCRYIDSNGKESVFELNGDLTNDEMRRVMKKHNIDVKEVLFYNTRKQYYQMTEQDFISLAKEITLEQRGRKSAI